MATSFDTIIDMALVNIQDYKLDKLYSVNQTNFQVITDGFLKSGVPSFTECRKSLEYDAVNRTFVADLTSLEISILADLWVYAWFYFHVNNVTQFENHMSPSDFKHFSEAANLKEKSEYLDRLREKYEQKKNNYECLDLASIWKNNGLI